MPPRSKVHQLPPEVKQWLDRTLAETSFSGYEVLADELASRGFTISKSALHRYGQDFESRLSALKMASEQAKAVVQAAPDEEGAVNEALMRLVQEHLFKLLMAQDGALDLPKVARAVAELGRATVVQKKWQAEHEEAARQRLLKEQEENLQSVAVAQGMDADQVIFWREKVLGMR